MSNPLTRYILLAKRWIWVMLLGIILCSGMTYLVTKLMRPVYQATAWMIVTFGTSNSGYDNTTAALEALPTYAQIVTNPQVLQPVIAQHQGMTLKTLLPMITVKPQSNTQIIELDVNNSNPQLAAQLANEIGQSFSHYSSTQLPATIQVLPAQVPTDPIQPKPSTDAIIGALVGLGLSLALIIAFEWADDRMENPDEVQELLNLDVLTVIPRLSQRDRIKSAEETPALAESCRILSATLNAAQEIKPFKLVMITSALAGEGKSTIAANLATFLAMAGKRVLLVDADLRHPVQDQHFQIDNRHGLSNAFLEVWAQVEVELNGQPTEIPMLRVLTTGVLPSNPSELLQSQIAQRLFDYFKQSKQFDFVIFDTSPLLPVADAQIIASYIEVAILVTDITKTPRKVLLRAKQTLLRTRTHILGTVVNKSRWPDDGDRLDYIGVQQHAKADIALTIPETPTPVAVRAASNGKVKDEDITLTLSPTKKKD